MTLKRSDPLAPVIVGQGRAKFDGRPPATPQRGTGEVHQPGGRAVAAFPASRESRMVATFRACTGALDAMRDAIVTYWAPAKHEAHPWVCPGDITGWSILQEIIKKRGSDPE
jgi:hypothetical protein